MYLEKGVITIKGVIMSGGMGTRLRPLTCNLPKPMVPMFNKPVMEYGVELLKRYGIEDIAVTLYYLPDMIMDYFGDGSGFGANIKYYIEDKPLGTGGSVKNAYKFLDNTFIVISGDAFTDIDLESALDFHRKKDSKATLVLKREPIPLEYGVVITDGDGRITRFLEKPSWGEVFSDTINTGIYILEPEVLDYYEHGENFDFSRDLFPRLLEDGVPMYGYITEEYWCDIGDLNTYIGTHMDVLSNDDKHYLLGDSGQKGLWIGRGSIIEEGAEIIPPIYIGENTIIEAEARIEPYTVIGNNCIIGGGASIKRSIIWDDVNISSNCEIRKSAICNDIWIGERSRIFEGVAIGAYSRIHSGVTIGPNIKIWPYKTIGEDTEVKDNLIWEQRATSNLFGYRNISGLFNETITPGVAVKLGTSLASAIDDRGTYVVSDDEHNLSKSLKNSIISGILSTGSEVVDIKDSTIPMCRFGVVHFKADGGIHISTDNSRKDMVYIEFINDRGANIDRDMERKIENIFISEDFKRCTGDQVKDVINIYNFATIYLKSGMENIENMDDIRSQRPRLVIASPSKNISSLAERYLVDLGCQVKALPHRGEFRSMDIKNIVLDDSADLGILYDQDGEKVVLTDGFNILKDEKYYLLSILIALREGEIEYVVIPYNFPRIMEELTHRYRGNTIYSKSHISSVIETIIKNQLDFQYILNFDGIWAVGRIIDYLIGNDITLNQLIQELPEYFYLKKEIPCNWNDKGKVIRRLAEDGSADGELKEGVRFEDDRGWTLIIPDEEKPKVNLFVEGYSEEYAEELWMQYDGKIKELLGD
mgnify:CR=1 FL=1